MIKLVAFLGNPGADYAGTRHNVAWQLLERLPMYSGLPWREKFHGRAADVKEPPLNLLFLCPLTYVNRSGRSVAGALRFYKMSPDDLLVVHDDLELDYGVIDTKHGGGVAGHNGLRSIKETLGTAEFRRFRLGIGRPERGSVSSYVLSKFAPDEQAVLPGYLDSAARELDALLRGGEPVRRKRLIQ